MAGSVGWGGLHNYFHGPTNCSVEVVFWLCCVIVGVGTTILNYLRLS